VLTTLRSWQNNFETCYQTHTAYISCYHQSSQSLWSFAPLNVAYIRSHTLSPYMNCLNVHVYSQTYLIKHINSIVLCLSLLSVVCTVFIFSILTIVLGSVWLSFNKRFTYLLSSLFMFDECRLCWLHLSLTYLLEVYWMLARLLLLYLC